MILLSFKLFLWWVWQRESWVFEWLLKLATLRKLFMNCDEWFCTKRKISPLWTSVRFFLFYRRKSLRFMRNNFKTRFKAEEFASNLKCSTKKKAWKKRFNFAKWNIYFIQQERIFFQRVLNKVLGAWSRRCFSSLYMRFILLSVQFYDTKILVVAEAPQWKRRRVKAIRMWNFMC